MIVVYTMPRCGGCEALKAFLRDQGVAFAERKLMDAASITDLRMAGCHDKIEELMAPILQIGDRVMRYDDLFVGGELDKNGVMEALCALAPGKSTLLSGPLYLDGERRGAKDPGL